MIVLAAVLAAPLAAAPAAQSATISPSTYHDVVGNSAPCSLREAVSSANSNANVGGCVGLGPYGADVILLDEGDYNLSRVGTENANASGDLDITGPLTIIGSGSEASGIDGNGGLTSDRVIEGVGAIGLNLIDLTIHDGEPVTSGGGIRISTAGSALNLTNAVVSDNEVEPGDGGGIFASTATLTNSTVRNNTATVQGGGIYAVNGVTLTKSDITGNISGDSGGGLRAVTANLTNSNVSNNEANGPFGGGIRVTTQTTIASSTISGNSAKSKNGVGARGGGINGKTTISNSIVSGNQSGTPGSASGEGGGIYSPGFLDMTSTTVSGNRSELTGGGIQTSSFGSTIRTSKIRGNISANGGGLWSDGQGPFFINSTVTGNTARGGCGGFQGPSSVVQESVISRNSAETGGGGMCGSGELRRSSIVANDSETSAGGIAFSGGTLLITNSTISGNEAGANGGGITIGSRSTPFDDSAVTFRNSTVTANTADSDGSGSGSGGGLFQAGFDPRRALAANTILAGNLDFSPGAEAPDCSAPNLVSEGYNLFSSTAGCTITGNTAGNQTAADPRLRPLRSNGGPTPTHELISTSAARNNGYPGSGSGVLCESIDQRNVPRSDCDIGAYEYTLCQNSVVDTVGTFASETITGTSGQDVVLAQDGNDILNLGDGHDRGCGGGGNDTLNGSTGDDKLQGDSGTDTCNGGSGNDTATTCETISSIP